MTTISLPIWILVAAVGTPCICLFWLVVSLMRRKRMTRPELSKFAATSQWLEQRTAPDQFQQNLIGLQIDAVFNGMVALIETERIKLKSLMSINAAPGPVAAQSCGNPNSKDKETWDSMAEDNAATIDQQVAQWASKGENPTGIATHLGLSLAEVELAMKMRTSRTSNGGRKLEAVA